MRALPFIALLCLPLPLRAAAPTPAQPPAPASFTTEQVAAATPVYARQCAICHGAAQEGGEAGPALRGEVFRRKWAARPWQELFEQMRRTMPITQPGGLPRSQYEDLVALLLSVNGQAPGSTRLAASGVAPARAPDPPAPDTEWLHHRGDAGSHNYSPLAQIERGNLARLTVAWRWRSDNFGSSIVPNFEVTPL